MLLHDDKSELLGPRGLHRVPSLGSTDYLGSDHHGRDPVSLTQDAWAKGKAKGQAKGDAKGEGLGDLHPRMCTVCRNAEPYWSMQAGYTLVYKSISADAITHRHRQTDTDTHSRTDANLCTQTLNKPCKVKQKHEKDTQEGRASDK